MANTTLAHGQNVQAMKAFIRVKVELDSLESDLAKEYELESLPTWLILTPNGEVLKRREGFIGEVPFRNEFLSVAATKPSGDS
jgi:hypothetical protein